MCVFIPLVDLCPLPKQTPLWDQSLRALYHLNPPGPCATPLRFNKGALKHLTVTLTPSFWAPGDEANLEPGLGRANMSSLLLPCQPSCPPHTHTHTHTHRRTTSMHPSPCPSQSRVENTQELGRLGHRLLLFLNAVQVLEKRNMNIIFILSTHLSNIPLWSNSSSPSPSSWKQPELDFTIS